MQELISRIKVTTAAVSSVDSLSNQIPSSTRSHQDDSSVAPLKGNGEQLLPLPAQSGTHPSLLLEGQLLVAVRDKLRLSNQPLEQNSPLGTHRTVGLKDPRNK